MNFIFDQDQHGLLGTIYFKYHLFDTDLPLIITFAPRSEISAESAKKGLSPWGFDYIKKLGYNVLSFQCLKGNINYYRDNTFLKKLPLIGEGLPNFTERLSYGVSMGGYAATAFSNPLKVDRVLVISPITSRRRDIATWDYEAGRNLNSFDLDWNGNYTDGAISDASGYVVYDPLFDLDKLHAVRYTRLKPLRVPGLGHGITLPLRDLDMLTWLVESFIKDIINESEFYNRSRNRKKLKQYYQRMLRKENKLLTPGREKILKRKYL